MRRSNLLLPLLGVFVGCNALLGDESVSLQAASRDAGAEGENAAPAPAADASHDAREAPADGSHDARADVAPDASYPDAASCPAATPTRCSGGSCVDTTADTENCGACGVLCKAPLNAHSACVGSKCAIACDAGFTLCGGACVNLQSDPANCDKCGVSCFPPALGAATCTVAKCGYTCRAGTSDCKNDCRDYQTDAQNCGSCGHDCLGGACSQGICQPVPISNHGALGLAITGAAAAARLYWQDATDGTIWSWAVSASAPPARMTTNTQTLGTPSGGFAVDGTNAYWAKNSDPGQIWWSRLGADSAQVAADNQGAPNAIAAAGGYVFWANGNSHMISKLLVQSGQSPVVLAQPVVPFGVATDGVNVWYTSTFAQTVSYVSVNGGNATQVAALAVGLHPRTIVLDAPNGAVYWSDSRDAGGGDIAMAPKLGGAARVVATTQRSGTAAIALDTTYVYYGDNASILRARLGSTMAAEPLAAVFANALAIDDLHIYFTSPTGVYRIAK